MFGLYDQRTRYDRYTAADARADAAIGEAEDKRRELGAAIISDDLVEGENTYGFLESGELGDRDFPHPWTWARHLANIYTEDGDDGLDEYLRDYYEDEIDSAYDDWCQDNEGPCCNNFSCPCGNNNNFRGL